MSGDPDPTTFGSVGCAMGGKSGGGVSHRTDDFSEIVGISDTRSESPIPRSSKRLRIVNDLADGVRLRDVLHRCLDMLALSVDVSEPCG